MEQRELKRDLSNRHVQLIAIGGTIGTGLFLGSGKAIQLAGPSIIFAYFIVGIALFSSCGRWENCCYLKRATNH